MKLNEDDHRNAMTTCMNEHMKMQRFHKEQNIQHIPNTNDEIKAHLLDMVEWNSTANSFDINDKVINFFRIELKQFLRIKRQLVSNVDYSHDQ